MRRSAAARPVTWRCARSPSTPRRSSYEDLVAKYFEIHDPTQLNRQGPDVGYQYRSVIFTHSDQQAEVARKVIERVQPRFRSPIVTEVESAKPFWRAEEYHQCYLQKRSLRGLIGDPARTLRGALVWTLTGAACFAVGGVMQAFEGRVEPAGFPRSGVGDAAGDQKGPNSAQTTVAIRRPFAASRRSMRATRASVRCGANTGPTTGSRRERT